MHACRPTAVKQLANFSARLAGKAAWQGCIARPWGKFVHGEIGQFSLIFWFPPFLVLFLVFFTFNAEFSDLIWPPVAIIYIRSPKPVLLGKIGGNLRKFAEQKICPRRNWRISQFLVLKNRKNPFFHNFLFKIPIIPIWPLNSFFPSKTSLYTILKLLFRVKNNCQNNYGTLLTTVSNHCGGVNRCWLW
jgi:hypothetical protein